MIELLLTFKTSVHDNMSQMIEEEGEENEQQLHSSDSDNASSTTKLNSLNNSPTKSHPPLLQLYMPE